MIITLTVVAFLTPRFLEQEVNAAVDITAPTLPTVEISSNNTNNTEFAKLADTITLSIIADENIQTPTVTIAGESTTVTGSGMNYTATYTVVEETVEGVAAINITYTDLAGNAGTAVTATTDSSTVTVDKTVPTLSTAIIESDYGTPSKGYIGSTITLSITASEDIQRPIVTIAGQRATVTGSGDTYTATYTVLVGTPDGEAEIYVRFIDKAGNVGVPITETTNNSIIEIIYNIPIGNVNIWTSSNGSIAKVGDTITLTITGGLQPPIVTIARQTATVRRNSNAYYATHIVSAETPEGVVEFEILYNHDNQSPIIPVTATTNSSTVTVDKSVPTLEAVTIESDNHNTSLAKLGDTITVDITANKNLQTPTVTIAGQSAIVTGSGDKYTATYQVVAGTPEGVAGINITYTDEAGNAGTVVTTTNSSTVTIDKTAPTLEATIESDNDNPTSAKIGDTITLRLTTSELLLTIPTVTPSVRMAGQAVTVTGSGNEYMATYIVTAETPEGLAEINITFADLAGHAGIPVTATTNSSTVTVDKTVPILDSVAGGAVNTVDAATWIAPEATANDDIDGDISDDVVVHITKQMEQLY